MADHFDLLRPCISVMYILSKVDPIWLGLLNSAHFFDNYELCWFKLLVDQWTAINDNKTISSVHNLSKRNSFSLFCMTGSRGCAANCSHLCLNSPSGPHCACPKDMEPIGDTMCKQEYISWLLHNFSNQSKRFSTREFFVENNTTMKKSTTTETGIQRVAIFWV